jgi:hypothetical protein
MHKISHNKKMYLFAAMLSGRPVLVHFHLTSSGLMLYCSSRGAVGAYGYLDPLEDTEMRILKLAHLLFFLLP